MQNDKSKFKVVFMGTPDFAIPILESLFTSHYSLVAIITQPDKKVGREQKLVYSPVKKLALKHKIPVYQPEKLDAEIEQKISSLSPDLIVVAAYGKILPKSILDIPKFGSINVHASLLPKYRGASPIPEIILAGEKETGITCMLMDEKMDHGLILAQKKEKIYNNETGESLHDRLAKIGAGLLVETSPKWFEGKIKPKEQDHTKATYTKLLTRENGKIDWHKTAQELERQTRAYFPWPGSWTIWNGKRIKILQVTCCMLQETKKPGEVFLTKEERLAVACDKGYVIINKLQPEGKKEMTDEEFLRGHSGILGVILK